MVLCKYFQQGTCRFGQYCKFEHSYGNRSKTFGDEKNIALLVAEEVLQAERGGQWLLSCYGPFKEKKSIPGMEDFSPEEVRWEMYQAQKSGTADQINVQFQQMCEAMKAKRDALKNPTPAIVQLLEEVQNSGSENTAFSDSSKQNKGNFAFGSPQLSASNANQTSNVFGQKTFGAAASNPFGASTFNSTQASSSIFGRTATNNAASVFGGKPSFGGPSVFGGTAATPGSSIFGGANKTAVAPFGAVQNAPTFGGLASSGSSIFGVATPAGQSTFGLQPPAFGAAHQVQPAGSNAFLGPQPGAGQTSSVFSGAAQPAGNVFGAAGAGAAASVAPAPAVGSVFGATVAGAPVVSSAPPGTGIFGQTSQAGAAFGGAPIFGGAGGFGAGQPAATGAAPGSVFGGQSAFGAAAPAAGPGVGVFGGASAAAGPASFGALAQQGVAGTANAFGATAVVPTGNVFEAAPNAAPFGPATVATAAVGPFGAAMNPAATSVFATPASTATAGPFATGVGIQSTFSQPASFGFASPATNTTSVFGGTTATSSSQSPFGTANAFGNPPQQQQQQVFANSTTTTTSGPAANPFMAKTQQNTGSPFGVASQSAQQQSSPFGTFAKTTGNAFGTVSVTVMIDETAYSHEESLTDDEKAAYRMNAFHEGHIPLKPPSRELK